MSISAMSFSARAAALVTAAVLASGVAGADAQTMSRPGQMAQAAKAPPPMTAGQRTDDPAKVAVARQFILAYHPGTDPARVAKMIDAAMPRMIARAKMQDPKLDTKKFEQERRALILQNANTSLDVQAHIVSRHFSLAELNALNNFYRNGLGKKLTDESHKIQMELMAERRQQMLKQPLPGMKAQAAQPAAPQKGAAPHK